MPSPLDSLERTPLRTEPLMVAIAAVAVGMFIGTWIIGPIVSHDHTRARDDTGPTLTYDEMKARPDPFPYRTATPDFGVGGGPDYAGIARARAQGSAHRHETTGSGAARNDSPFEGWTDRSPAVPRATYPAPDRHRVF